MNQFYRGTGDTLTYLDDYGHRHFKVGLKMPDDELSKIEIQAIAETMNLVRPHDVTYTCLEIAVRNAIAAAYELGRKEQLEESNRFATDAWDR